MGNGEGLSKRPMMPLLLLLINLLLHFKIANYIKYMGRKCQGIQNQLEGTGTSPNLHSVAGIGSPPIFNNEKAE